MDSNPAREQMNSLPFVWEVPMKNERLVWYGMVWQGMEWYGMV